MAKFEGQERRMPGINACLKEYGMNTLEDARDLTLEHGINVEEIVKAYSPLPLITRCGPTPWVPPWP